MDIGNLDIRRAVAVEIRDAHVHPFVGILADRTEMRSLDSAKPFSLLIQVKIIRPEV